MSSIEEFLTQTSFFNGLSASEAIEVLQCSKKIKLPKGLDIVTEGDDGESFYLITEGRAEIIMNDHANTDSSIKIASLNQGDVFGEMVLIGKLRRQATAKAYQDIELLEWEKKSIEALFNEKPTIAYKVLKNLAKIMSDRLMDMNLKLRNNSEDINQQIMQSGFLVV